MKFIKTVSLVDDKAESQLGYDMGVLAATVVFMGDYYKNIFDDLDSILKAANTPPPPHAPANQKG